MVDKNFFLWIIFLLGFAVNSLSAQNLKYRSDIINREDGLSNNSVCCILKDANGFMWFGTWNGLNRYDGYDITVFQADQIDSSSISNNKINCLFLDRDSILWVGTNHGLNSYNFVTGKFTRHFCQPKGNDDQHNNIINVITQDDNGTLWIGCAEGVLVSLNKNKGKYCKHRITSAEGNTSINALIVDKNNSQYLWVGTNNGLYIFDKSKGQYHKISQGSIEKPVSVQTMLQDDLGNIYLGTWGNGLMKLYAGTSKITCVFDCNHNASDINGIILSMAFDIYGNIIFNERDRGIRQYNMQTARISDWNGEGNSEDIVNLSIASLYTDPDGLVWIGTLHDGVIKAVPLVNEFKHYTLNDPAQKYGNSVTAILEDSKGFLWLGTRFGGLFRINRTTGEQVVFKQKLYPENGLNNILSLCEVINDKKQYIWIGTDGGGLCRLDPLTQKFRVYDLNNDKTRVMSRKTISSMIRYDQDYLIIAAHDRDKGEGIDVFNMITGKSLNLRNHPDDSTSLGNNYVMVIFRDRKGRIWLGTRNGGLNRFIVKDINAEKAEELGCFRRYPDPESPDYSVFSIQDDDQNNLWLGTTKGGLVKFDIKKCRFTAVPTDKYVKNSFLFGLLSDNHKNLWASTSMGIIEFNPCTNQVHWFDKFDGIQEKSYIFGSCFKSSSGEMFFGGIRGCNSFHPDSIKLSKKVPGIIITSLTLSGKKRIADVSELTGNTAIASKLIRVPYTLNNIAITFSMPDFHKPWKNKYKYMLSGYDHNWTETDTKRRYVNYTNLPPGKYVFKVIGTNSDDIWDYEGTSFTLIITPPLWKTLSFHICIVLLILGFLSYVFYAFVQKTKLEKKQVELEAQLSLQDERKQLRTLIDTSPDLIFIKDRNSRFTVANKRVAQVMGSTPENLIGKTDFDFYEPDVARTFFDEEQKIMTEGKSMINYEETVINERGNRMIVATTKVPIKNKEGQIIGLAGVCRDITQLKQIEKQLIKKTEDLLDTNRLLEKRQNDILFQSEELAEQTQHLLKANAELEHLNRTKDKFFSIIAHDLRNPFSAIIGFGDLLRDDFHTMDDQQKLNVLELIHISSQTAYNLLENLLQWARTQTDKIKFNPENFDLAETIDSVMDLHCGIARKKSVRLVNEIKPETFVYADKNMISTVLRNLISNAIKFSNMDGTVTVTGIVGDKTFEINVTDNGIGMSRENLNKLFRIDTYYSSSGTMGETGTGLGLIICKEFVEKNNGRIKAISAPGEGTTLSFTLNQAKLN